MENHSHCCGPSRGVDSVFAGEAARWRPLYDRLLSGARARHGAFEEFAPKEGIIWRERSNFASILLTKNTLRVNAISNTTHPERNPSGVLVMSPTRVNLQYALAFEDDISDVLDWITESYVLTQLRKKG